MSTPNPAPSAPEPLGPAAARGRRVAQVLFFAALVWVIVSGAVQILAEGLFAKKVPRDAAACRAELAVLRTRLADASLLVAEREGEREGAGKGELAAVAVFREVLGGEAGRAWDLRALELVDGCPPEEAAAAYALARLRASQEAMVRIDAREVAPARDAYKKATSK